ncbi:MAG: NACHT domain-containing protein [Ktedonobacteraceae bacterium]|nr:NACHT domain-containing protein [Ktedonobacteraceae bacterium]
MSSSPPSPPFLGRFWPTLLRVLAVFGVPAATVAIFSRFVKDYPLPAFLIGVLYELTVFIFGFVGKVCQILKDRWAERTVEWFDHWVQDIISCYPKQYYHYLRYRHQYLDVKGLSIQGPHALELDQIFVEPSITPSTPHTATPNPIQVSQAPPEGSHTICDYLVSAPLRNQHLVVIGPPGSGKTILLKHITLMLVAPRKALYQTSILHKLPILLFLRDHANEIEKQPDFSLVDAVHEHLKKWDQPPPPREWFRQQLTKGRCIVMLDGLDEVADPKIRQVVADWVQRQMIAYCQNRFIVTSRPFGYHSNPLSGVTVLEVRLFAPEQVEQFIDKWYLANEIMTCQKDGLDVRTSARVKARELVQQLRNIPALFELTVNPLLLTMIATVHRYGRELPDNRAALYAEICKVFLGSRQRAPGQVLEITPVEMQMVLERLAYHLMVRGIRDIPLDGVRDVIQVPLKRLPMSPEAFLQLIEDISGLLLERESGVYSFAHLTFQEYLAAMYIQRNQMGHTLVAQVKATWWQETIRLYCAMADATPIINACLADDYPSATSIELAIDCDEEACQVQPEARARLETLLGEGVEDLDPERQHVIAGALLARRLREMRHLHDETYGATSFITCAEYQVFLDEQRARGQCLQPDHWTSYRFLPGQGNTPVLGVRLSDAIAFCGWLTERETGPWHYRLPAAGELEDEGRLEELPTGTGYWLMGGQGFARTKEVPILSVSVLEELVRDVFSKDGNLERVLDQVGGILHTLARAIHALDRDSDPIYNFDSVRTLDRARALDRVFERAYVVVSALTDALAHPLDRVRARPFALALALALAGDLARPLDHILDYIHNHVCAGPLTLTLDPTLDRFFPYCQRMPPSRRQTRQLSAFGRTTRREEDAIQRPIDNLLDIYMNLVIVEGRIRGQLPACEGILIVKEHK